MLTTRIVVSVFSIGQMVLGAGGVSGQNYPNKPIRVVTAEAGGASDFAARQVAQGLTAGLGQQAIVDNRGGAVMPSDTVAKAPSDGYTVLVVGSPLWLLPFMQTNVPFDPVRDFSPITQVGSAPNILVVHPSVPVKSVKELISLAKARPGGLNYASGPIGGSTHTAPELFKSMAGVNIVHIPYKGVAQALNDVIAGQVQIMFPSASSGSPLLKSGRLRALAVTSAQPSALFPGLPTVAASGVPGYEVVAMTAMFAPAKTPGAIIRRLNQEVVRYLNQPMAKEQFLSVGAESVGSSPEELGAKVKSEMAKWGKLIKDLGIRNE